jgi:hypothetical protein
MGINPYSSWRIREFGGAAIKDMTPTRRRMTEVRSMLDFSGSLSDTPGSTDAQGFYASLPHFSSPFLSGSRVEVGAPTPVGTFVNKTEFFPHGISDDPNDGLFTSGSYTVEGLVKFPPVLVHDDFQSLYRLHTTGSAQEHSVLANLVAQQEDVTLDRDASLNLFVRSANSTTDTSLLHLSLTDVNVFDGDPWYVSFGRKGVESDQPVSASYFLRAGKITARDRVQLSSGSQVFESNSGGDLFSLVTSTANASGSFLVVGEQAISTGAGLYGLGDTTTVTSSLAQVTTFSGKVAELRFWSKALDGAEWLEHVRNPRSVGVRDPLVNYNFVTDRTGSFERLRLDLSTDQPTTASDISGALQLVDFSQNFEDTTVAGLEASVQVIDPERFDFTMIEPKFDERSAENKIRVRGWQDPENIELYGGTVAPASEVRHPAESPQDDTRLSIEMSMVKALDEDIVNVMATLDAIERAIGGPEMLFTRSYPELEKLRRVYFQRLTGRVNYSRFLEIYKWFDDSLEFFVSKLLPAKTDFLGVNFVVESHMLERSKVSYAFYTQYLDNRGRAADFQDPDGPDELDATVE